MLVLRRKEGSWTFIKCQCGCGKEIKVRVCRIREHMVDLVFNDDEKNFQVDREERVLKKNA